MTSPIIYRKCDDEIVAIFPNDPFDNHSNLITCYSHIGQHSSCSWEWVFDCTTEPQNDEIGDLHRELIMQGYNNYQSIPMQDYATLKGIRYDLIAQ